MKNIEYKYLTIKGNSIIVKTPNPYIVILQREHETIDDAKSKLYSLNESCKFLFDMLRVLGVSKKEAKQLGYTLNIDTGNKLSVLAGERNISHKVFMLIRNHNW